MLWQIVAFINDKSVASVPKPWIKKFKTWMCYWPDKNAQYLRKKSVQPPIKKNSKHFYKCRILLKGEVFSSFQEALAAELKITSPVPKKNYKKPRYIKPRVENGQHIQTKTSGLTENGPITELSVDIVQPMIVESIQTFTMEPDLNSEPLITKAMFVEQQLNEEPLTITELHTEPYVDFVQSMVAESIQPFTMEHPFNTGNQSDSKQAGTFSSDQPMTTVVPIHKQSPTIFDPLTSESLIPNQLIPEQLNAELHKELTVDFVQPIVVEPIKTEVVTCNSMEIKNNEGKLTLSSTGVRFWKKKFLDDYRFETMESVKINGTPDSQVNFETPATTNFVITELFISETVIPGPVINNPEIRTEWDTIITHSLSTSEYPFTSENQSVNSDQPMFIESLTHKETPMISERIIYKQPNFETAEPTISQQLFDTEFPTILDTNLKNVAQSVNTEQLPMILDPNIFEPLNIEPTYESLFPEWIVIQPSLNIKHPLFTENRMNLEHFPEVEQQLTTKTKDSSAKSLNTDPLISETMSNIDDCLQFPVVGLDILERSDPNFGRNGEGECTSVLNEIDFGSCNQFFATSDNPGAHDDDAMITLDNVVGLLSNQINDDSASDITYVLNSMIEDIESSADSQRCTDGYDSCDSYETESARTSQTDKMQQQQQRNVIVQCQVQPLGSNNYQDSKCYLYTKNNLRKSNLYLRCKNSVKHHCLARVTVRDNNFEESIMTIGHNHPPEKKNLDRQVFDKKLEENIDRDPFETPRQVYLATKQELMNTIDTTHIPSLKKLEGFIYRRQRKYVPKLPSTIEEFEESVADQRYREFFTKDQRKLPFYRGCWMSAKGERNLVFISQTVLKLINTMNYISLFMDGTYKALPYHIPFRQLYVICVTYENQCYPLAYIFMEKKTFSSYDTIFQNLKFLMLSVEVVKVMTDYEAATRKALRKHYPEARIAGCFFHYVQAIVKCTKRFGLRKDDRFSEAIKKVCHLALLPNDFVRQGFECIDKSVSNIESKRWDRFRSYWLKQWEPANISVYGLGDRTNNFSESNNKSLNLLLLKHHPNIWNLIKNLKLLEMDKSDKITRAKLGEIFKLKKSNDSLSFDKKLQLATDLFEKDQNIGRFLERVTYGPSVELFVKDQINIMDDSGDEDVDDEADDEVIPNHYNRGSDFRKNHPRQVVSLKN